MAVNSNLLVSVTRRDRSSRQTTTSFYPGRGNGFKWYNPIHCEACLWYRKAKVRFILKKRELFTGIVLPFASSKCSAMKMLKAVLGRLGLPRLLSSYTYNKTHLINRLTLGFSLI